MVQPSTDHMWVWDGPAIDYPMGPSVMGLGEGTRFFRAKNVIFLFAATTEFALDRLKKFKRVVCDVTKWKFVESGRYVVLPSKEEALRISRFSQSYGNIAGGYMDDLVELFRREKKTPRDLGETYLALKKYNPSLQLYAAIYTHEFDLPIVKEYLPSIDIVNIWVWKNTENLRNLDAYVERCPEFFPDKPIILGLYLYDYPTRQPMPKDLLEFEFRKAIQYIREEKIIGFSILAASLIDHFPETANWVKKFLEKNLSDLQ